MIPAAPTACTQLSWSSVCVCMCVCVFMLHFSALEWGFLPRRGCGTSGDAVAVPSPGCAF